MSSCPSDTNPAIWERLQAGIARMTPRQRTERVASLTVLAHSFALADIRGKHPGESEREHRLRLAVRLYGPELIGRAFGWTDD